MTSNLISSTLLLCEKVLIEKDEVLSVMRMFDTYYLPVVPDVDPDKSPNVAAPITFLAVCRFDQKASGDHVLKLRFINPENTASDVGKIETIDLSAIPVIGDAPKSINVIWNIVVAPKRLGTYFAVLVLDDVEVDRAPFTFLLQPDLELPKSAN